MLIRAAGKRISEKLARHFIEIAGIDAAFVKHTAVAPFLHIDGVGDKYALPSFVTRYTPLPTTTEPKIAFTAGSERSRVAVSQAS